MRIQPPKEHGQKMAEARVEDFHEAAGPFVVAADMTRMPMAFTDSQKLDNPIIFANDSFLKLVGYKRDEVLSQKFAFVLDIEMSEQALVEVQAAFGDEPREIREVQYQRKDGRKGWASLFVAPVRDKQKNIVQHFLSLVDISQFKSEAQTAALLVCDLNRLFEQAPGFLCLMRGPEHRFELANKAYLQLVGHKEIIGRRVVDVMPELVSQGILDKLDAVYKTGVPFNGRAVPVQLKRMSESQTEQCYLDFIYQPIRDDAGNVTGILTQGNDVTEAFLLAQDVTYQAAHDSLTGLYNRREFGRQMQAGSEPGSHALFYMDLDQFKIVNDCCGHGAGDMLLINVASALQAECRDDDLLARLGGDEFALVRRDCGSEEATKLANDLREAVKEIVFDWKGQRYTVTLSVGVVIFGDDESLNIGTALGLADAACFLAKEKGRNRVQMSRAIDGEVTFQRLEMNNATRLADAMREGRILLYKQEIVGLQCDQAEQQRFFEVLARLRENDGTIISPAGFIPAAERFGMIEELDRHIVCKTFAHVDEHAPREQLQICYFINLSSITLSSPDFPRFIETALTAYPAVRTSQICFEVTETAAMSNVNRTAEAMRELVAKGFRFALDDFGSGMASFAYLSHLPVQFVKIDGEFVRAIIKRPADGVIVEAVAKVAQAMNIQTIAESVEYDELLPLLKSLGIDYGQGYTIHRPEPI